MTARFQAPKGTYDVLPPDAALRRRVGAVARAVLATAGYGEIATPIFEDTELFSRGVGETTDVVRKEMYTFEDRGGRSLTLRPEGTAAICRAYVQHGMHKLPLPVKLWYEGPMFRFEAPQSGRFRQHHQIGAEAIGSDDPALDAELIHILAAIYARLGIAGVKLRLSSIGDSTCRPGYVDELRDHLTRSGAFAGERLDRVRVNPLRAFDWTEPDALAATAGAPKMVDRLCAGCRDHLDEVRALLGEVGVEHEVDPRLVRGLDYYTRTVFEFTCDALGAQNGIGGGGRYDGLVEQIGGPPAPAAGWATGVERVVLAMGLAGTGAGRGAEGETTPAAPIDAFVAVTDAAVRRRATRLVGDLRERGVAADTDHAARGLKGQMRHAGRAGAAVVAILDPGVLDRGAVTVRDMTSGEQREMPEGELVAEIERLAGKAGQRRAGDEP